MIYEDLGIYSNYSKRHPSEIPTGRNKKSNSNVSFLNYLLVLKKKESENLKQNGRKQ